MSYNPKVVSFDRSCAYVHHRAMVNRRENHPIDALELMRRAAERAPENREYQLDLAELYCEMGCHEQSGSLLLDMLAKGEAPAECYYGLALNQLGMNDLEGARQSLKLYRHAQPQGEHAMDVQRLTSELEIFDALNRPVSRKLYRAMRVADNACSALWGGDTDRAIRLFERSLSLASEQFEMRAMYAMALMMNEEDDRAIREAERAAQGFPPSNRARCVSAQVFAALNRKERAKRLLREVLAQRPEGVELRLLIDSMAEVGMHEEISECTRIALQESPFDRQLLHIRAVALNALGTPDAQVIRFWQRILRIDPQDGVAEYYHDACMREILSQCSPTYAYQVPEAEFQRRAQWLAEQLGGGLDAVREKWTEDGEFQKIVLWAAQCEEEKLRRAALTVMAAMDDAQAQTSLRALMFRRDLPPEAKQHAATLLQLRGADIREIFPTHRIVGNAMMPEAQSLLADLSVGERQMIRYAAEVVEREYANAAEAELALLWTVYRRGRGTHTDPLLNTQSAAAALVYNYLLMHGGKPSVEKLSGQFACSARRMVFYAARISEVIEQTQRGTEDEDL